VDIDHLAVGELAHDVELQNLADFGANSGARELVVNGDDWPAIGIAIDIKNFATKHESMLQEFMHEWG
jgi:hypothetical protein